MLFVLGVMVGKRIESRGQADAPVMADPLAALDRARQPPPGVAAPDQPLTFQSSLVSGGAGGKAKAASARAIAPPAPPAAPRPIAARNVVAAPRPIASAKSPAAAPVPKPIVVARPPGAPVVSDPAKAKGRFTLHLSTFGSADEAAAFAQKYPGAFVVSGDVPGKGMAYRVRYGNYASFKDAAAAKDSFEKQHNTIALVAAR
jgi:cell division septation protein DedD